MNKKFFIICVIFFLIIFLNFCYKFLFTGKNKNIKGVNELDSFILSIQNYRVDAELVVNSNKNSNTYILKEKKENGILIQQINDTKNKQSIEIENGNNKLTIKNTRLGLTKIYEDYKDVLDNVNGLDSFIEDYKSDTKKKIKEEKDYYIVSVKCKEISNKYCTNKTLYFNKKMNSIDKLEIKDINNNSRIIIKYSNFKIL